MEHDAAIKVLSDLISEQSDLMPPPSVVYGLNAILGGATPALVAATVEHPAGDTSTWTVTACTDELVAQVEITKAIKQWSGFDGVSSSDDEAQRLEVHRIANLRTLGVRGQTRPYATQARMIITRGIWTFGFAGGLTLEIDAVTHATYGRPGVGEDIVDYVRQHWLGTKPAIPSTPPTSVPSQKAPIRGF